MTFAYSFADRWTRPRPRLRSAALGVLFGVAAGLAMQFTFTLEEGVIFDGRAMMVALAGGFGGPVAGIISFTIAGLVRASIGGAGMFVGITSTSSALVTGTLGWWWLRRTGNRWTLPRLAVLGVVTYLTVPAWFPLIPGITSSSLWLVWSTMFYVFVPGTIVGGFLLEDQNRRALVEQRLEVMDSSVSASPDSIFWVNPSGEVVWSNPSAEEELHLSGHSHWSDVFAASERERIVATADGLDVGQEVLLEAAYVGPNGVARDAGVALFRLHPTGAPDHLLCVVLRDMTEIAETRERLQEALDSKDAFLSSVSHELRTPLTELYGFAESLAHDPHSVSEDERQEVLERIAVAGITASDVLDDLLVVSRLSMEGVRINLEDLDLRRLAGDAATRHPEWDITVVSDEAPVVATGDRTRVHQILRNLIANAVEHGGDEITVRVKQQADMAILCVCDNGGGLSDEVTDTAFDLHESTSLRNAQALGIGLWLSRNLAHLMDGRLQYRRENGITHFELDLPLAPED